ncbi:MULTISPECIES: TonB family protein [unclassified Pseudomonas]|uniref:TonB family protein n=1 Tax=unclassified Pseudomonas TaxID=196821 RepID=UPI00384BC1BC
MAVVKVLSISVAMLISARVDANFKIEPIGAPVVKFQGDAPSDTRRVQVEYTVHYDGHITDVEVMTPTDAAFEEAAKAAVSEWRFKPWPRDGNPEAVRLSVILNRGEAGGLRAAFRRNVLNLKCDDLNKRIDEAKVKDPGFNSRKLDIYTESSVVLDLLPRPGNNISYQEAESWRMYFSGVFPSVLRGCRANPSSLYIDQLPELMRRRLPQAVTQ